MSGLAMMFLLASGCAEPTKAGGCPDGGTWAGNPDYDFFNHNWSCDPAAISVPFDLDAESFFTTLSIKQSDIRQELDDVVAVWNAAGADITLTVGDTALRGGVVDQPDGKSQIFMSPHGKPFGGDATVATTYDWHFLSETTKSCDMAVWSTHSGVLLSGWTGPEFDYIVNGDADDTERIDMTDLLTHELGHCIGFDHNLNGPIYDATPTVSVMRSGQDVGVEFAGLSTDDIAALIFVYGT